MATFACVSLPPQFITPPPSTSNCTRHNESDCGSSTGTNEGGMKADGSEEGSQSSQESQSTTPPEFPSPPPPSNSPPESMASFKAESPIGDEDTGGTRLPDSIVVTQSTANGEPPRVNVWMAQHGFHPVPIIGVLPGNPSVLFVHVNQGETLQFMKKDGEVIGNLIGPGSCRMMGEPGKTSNPLPVKLRPDQQCHQFLDEEGTLRHVVLSVASQDSGTQNPRELNVPQIVGSHQLMQVMGMSGGKRDTQGNAMNGASTSSNGDGTVAPPGEGNHGNGNHGDQENQGNQDNRKVPEISVHQKAIQAVQVNGHVPEEVLVEVQQEDIQESHNDNGNQNGQANQGHYNGNVNPVNVSRPHNNYRGHQNNRYGAGRGGNRHRDGHNDHHGHRYNGSGRGGHGGHRGARSPVTNYDYLNHNMPPEVQQQQQQLQAQIMPLMQPLMQGQMQSLMPPQHPPQVQWQMQVPMVQSPPVQMQQVDYQMIQNERPEMSDQQSLLGAPVGPPMSIDMGMVVQNNNGAVVPQQGMISNGMIPMEANNVDMSQNFNGAPIVPMIVGQQQQTNGEQSEMALTGIPVMNGHSGLLQDPNMSGGRMQMFQVPPPPNGVVMQVGSQFNNNSWFAMNANQEANDIHRILSVMMMAPEVQRTFPTTMEFSWKLPNVFDHLYKTMNGLYPNIRSIDLIYHAVLYNKEMKFESTYVLDIKNIGTTKRCFSTVQNLQPNTSYHIAIKAEHAERRIQGEPTTMVPFFTTPGRPDAPSHVAVPGRGPDFLAINWDAPQNNGAFISHYYIYIFVDERSNGRSICVSNPQVHIPGLLPQTRYKVWITAVNALGESLTSFRLDSYTKPVDRPNELTQVKITPLSHRAVRLEWDTDPNSSYRIQMYRYTENRYDIVRTKFVGNNTIVGNLESDSRYAFLFTATNVFGDRDSAWYETRTQVFRNGEIFPRDVNEPRAPIDLDRPPQLPTCKKTENNCPLMCWKSYGPGQAGHIFVAEAATFEDPDRFCQLYRGPEHSLYITDFALYWFRVYVIHKNGERSLPSEKVIIPRDYNIYKPGLVTDVTISLTVENRILVNWMEPDLEKLNLPASARVFYYIHRADLIDTPIICTQDATFCIFEPITEPNYSFRVRVAVAIHEAHVWGDWTLPMSCAKPERLLSPVHNIIYHEATSQLVWLCNDDSSSGLKYNVRVIQMPGKQKIASAICDVTHLIVKNLQPGVKYRAVVGTFTETHRSQLMAADIELGKKSTPVPSTVQIVETAQQQNQQVVPDYSQKTSPVEMHREIIIEEESEPESTTEEESKPETPSEDEPEPIADNVSSSHVTDFHQTVEDVTPDTQITERISEQNPSEPTETVVEKEPTPPHVPELKCEADHNSLRLFWDSVQSDSKISYKAMRISDRGQTISLFEGENTTFKVRSLTEDTDYTFILRVTDKKTSMTSISDQFTFRTTIAPPPPVKSQPTATLVAGEQYLYKIEWTDCIRNNKKTTQCYRLQAVDATIKNAKWQTVYEGTSPNFEINTSDYPGALHIRVICVRKDNEKTEMRSSPSPVGYIANDPPEVDVKADSPQKNLNWWALVQRYAAPVTLITIFVLLISVSLNCTEVLFNWVTDNKQNIGSSSNNNAHPDVPSSFSGTK